MAEDSKNEETLRIEISHFATSPKRDKRIKIDSKDEIWADKTMKISIERKSAKKSVINVNLNENDSPGKETSENINIKIEKNKKSNKKERKEFHPRGSYSKSPRSKAPSKSNSIENSNDIKNFKPVPGVSGKCTERRDAAGNLIGKGLKNYKVTFVDQLTNNRTKFEQVVKVNSFKSFNVDISQDIHERRKSESCCGSVCIIF